MNIKLLTVIIILASSFFVSSCLPGKAPYEVKSPCVSGDSENPWVRNPCIRKPLSRDIA